LCWGFRPDAVETVADGDGLAVITEGVEELGSDAYLFASLPDREDLRELGDLVVRIDRRSVPAKGQKVTIRIRPDELHVFSIASGERLN
jgi:multiple sugar transport system ATP-binding protein